MENNNIEELRKAFLSVQITTKHKLPDRFKFIAEDIFKIGNLVFNQPYRIKLSEGVNTGDWVEVELNDNKWHTVYCRTFPHNFSQHTFKQKVESDNLESLFKPVIHNIFKQDYSFYITSSVSDTPIKPEAIHLAKLLSVIYTTPDWWSLHIEKSISQQLQTFLETGTIPIQYPETYNSKTDTLPNRILSVSDRGDELIWKHGKYCSICKNKISSCYCNPVNDIPDITYFTVPCCYSCGKEGIIKGLMKNYTKTFTKTLCDDIWNNWVDWVMEDNDYFLSYLKKDGTFKKLTKKDAEKVYDIISDNGLRNTIKYSCIWDINSDKPEDSCSCPIW